eukprot:4623681-Pleurochrysis_carterae.AAC.1
MREPDCKIGMIKLLCDKSSLRQDPAQLTSGALHDACFRRPVKCMPHARASKHAYAHTHSADAIDVHSPIKRTRAQLLYTEV